MRKKKKSKWKSRQENLFQRVERVAVELNSLEDFKLKIITKIKEQK